MKVLYKNARILSLLLSFMFLLQSCVVYHKTAMSFDEAVAANKRMKVTTTDNKKYKFKRILKSDSTYYGLTLVRNQMVKVPLHTDKIQSIRPVNGVASVFLTIGVVFISYVGLIALAWAADDDDVYIGGGHVQSGQHPY
ncbi:MULTISPECIES: hypothetical protein [Flavobacterium]|uniref:hypothetical protein n=1 Tax=Flavobacterium TaxID=237 RepID=UPI001FCBB126|nr:MULTISPECIES: hypothetical protein [Flavobacterium]UOK43561.1 hypothetical protein LZF87_05420 [Flavobacterium enshiense]